MSFVVSCQCGKQFRVADEQMGRKSRCKGCGTVLHLVPDAAPEEAPPPRPPPPPPPAADHEADPFANVDWDAPDSGAASTPGHSSGGAAALAPPPLPTPAIPVGPNQVPCPACGSMISAFAMRCEHCGASLNAMLGAGGVPAPAYTPPFVTSDETDLSTGDWLLCIFCSGIGCILGIVYLVQGKPKGGKMLGLSLLFAFIKNAIGLCVSMSRVQTGPTP